MEAFRLPRGATVPEAVIVAASRTPIGRAEVVVAGENYGLKVIELADLDLDSLAP